MAYLVVGESVAGVAAALEFASAGCAAHIILYHGDNNSLEDSWLIGPTPLNAVPMRGTAFSDLARETLHAAGVKTRCTDIWFGSWDSAYIDAASDELVLDDSFQGEQHRFRGAVFAPSGSEPGLPGEIEASFATRGLLSYSACSDAACFCGKPIAVVGSGYHAFEQALIAAEHAASVTVLCEKASVRPLGLLESEVSMSERLTVLTSTRVLSLEAESEHGLAGVLIEERGHERLLPVEGVFVAQDPVVGWWAWGSQEEALPLQQCGKLVLAGIAAGVPYHDHAALFENGVRAARQCLTAET